MTDRRGEAGFALPLAIFFMAILTLLLTAAFAKVQGDRRVADSSGAAVTALAFAQTGLQTYLGSTTARPPDGDSTRINLSSGYGYADVVAYIVDHMVDTMSPELYVVKSTGHVIDPTQGADPQASRTIAQFAQWRTGTLTQYPAVFTAANGLNDYIGGTVTISGSDSTSCGDNSRGGLRVPNNQPRAVDAPPNVSGPAFGFVDGGGKGTVADLVGVDWDTVQSGGFTADYTTLTNLNSWSSYLISGNATLSASGSGLLIVTDNLTITGASINWAGVILVGKSIIFNGAYARISGLLATGLDEQLGGAQGQTSNGSVGGASQEQVILYNSCNVRKAMQGVIGFSPIGNGWVENWATY